MNTTTEKIEAASTEKASHEQTIRNLRGAIEQAADAGNLGEVKSMQIEIAAVQELAAACGRRLEKLRAEQIAEQKASRQTENENTLKRFKSLAGRLPPRARKISQAIATLAKELEAFQTEAAESGEVVRHLTQQIVGATRSDAYHQLPQHAAFMDEVLGFAVGEEIRRAGIFTTLAPCSAVRLDRQDILPIEQLIETRVDLLADRAAQVCSIANQGIDHG